MVVRKYASRELYATFPVCYGAFQSPLIPPHFNPLVATGRMPVWSITTYSIYNHSPGVTALSTLTSTGSRWRWGFIQLFTASAEGSKHHFKLRLTHFTQGGGGGGGQLYVLYPCRLPNSVTCIFKSLLVDCWLYSSHITGYILKFVLCSLYLAVLHAEIPPMILEDFLPSFVISDDTLIILISISSVEFKFVCHWFRDNCEI